MCFSSIFPDIQQCPQFLFLPYSITYSFTMEKQSSDRFGHVSTIGALAKVDLFTSASVPKQKTEVAPRMLGKPLRRSQVSRSSKSLCCAQNALKTAKAFTSVSALKELMLRPE